MRVAIYCRVSTEDQADRGTIESQREFGAKYADLHQLDVADWYIDDGITGTIPLEERTAGARLMADAKAKMFEMLLVYRLDRLGRSARITLNAVYELERCGVQVRSMTEPFDTGDASGRFMLTILAGQADFERSTILDRLWHGANRHARAGEWLGGIVPYGYVVREKRLAVDEEPLPMVGISRAEVVRIIYRLCADMGWSTIRIADYLNARHIPPSYVADGREVRKGQRKTGTAGIWRPGRVRNMIVNTTYKGIHVYGRRTAKKRDMIERAVPAIVTPEQWDKAQATLRENQIEATRNARHQYLLKGLIKCGACGLTYIGSNYSGAGRKPKGYYVCNGKQDYRGPSQGKCTNRNIPQQWIEDMVWDACESFIRNPGEAFDQLAAAMEARQSQKESLEAELAQVVAAADNIDDERQAILDLYRRKLISSQETEAQLAKSAQDRFSLDARAEDLRRQIAAEGDIESARGGVEQLLARLRRLLDQGQSFAVRREIVKTLVSQIIVNPDDDGDEGSKGPGKAAGRPGPSVTIRYRFEGSTGGGVARTYKGSWNTAGGLVLIRSERLH